jgi:hypothetical protein
MKPTKILTIVLAIALLGSAILVIQPIIVKATPINLAGTVLPGLDVPFDRVNGTMQVDPLTVEPIYFSVENSSGGNLIMAPAIGNHFTVYLKLHNATTGNIALGIGGVEVHFNFANILTWVKPLSFTDNLGLVGGVLNSTLSNQVLEAPNLIGGFYDSLAQNATNADGSPFANATQYIVGGSETSGYGWWNDGTVATITFNETATKVGSFPLDITYADLTDININEVPFSIVQGTFDPLYTPGAPMYYSVVPTAPGSWIPGTYSQGVNSLEAFGWPSQVGQTFTVNIFLNNATTTNLPGGVFGVEVDLDFTAITSFCNATAFFDGLVPILGSGANYSAAAGFYDSAYNRITNPAQYYRARHYIVAANADPANVGSLWNGNAGLIAQLIFVIAAQPPTGGSPYIGSLNIEYADLTTVHDVAVTNVMLLDIPSDASGLPKTIVGQGSTFYVNVTVADLGNFGESFNVTLNVIHMADATTTTVSGLLTKVTLAVGGTATVTLPWNTTGFAYGNYTVTGSADTVPGEVNTDNNNLNATDKVLVTLGGDVIGTGKVFLDSLGAMAAAWTSTPASPNWNPNADVTCSGKVFLDSLGVMAAHWTQSVTLPVGDP